MENFPIINTTSTGDILRISEIYQKCRYAKKTQLSLDLKKYRYAGDIAGFKNAEHH
jgi:hypothetical protein